MREYLVAFLTKNDNLMVHTVKAKNQKDALRTIRTMPHILVAITKLDKNFSEY